MTKKCLGCGITLQTDNPSLEGYTPDIKHDLCARCFKIKHYNAMSEANLNFTNEDLIQKINKDQGFVIFLTDFLNLNEEVINTFKNINNPKILVLTKEDLIPKNILKTKLLENIKNKYNIQNDIIYFSIITKTNAENLLNFINSYPKVYLTGFTNSGKSSFINYFFKTDITVSKKANTTLDFIKIKYNKTTIIDTPGFRLNSFYEKQDFKGQIKPLTYQLLAKYYLKIGDLNLACNIDNNLTLYLSNNIRVEKRKKIESFPNNIKVKDNQDLIIKGLGFIMVKKSCVISGNIDLDYIEVRDSIVGGKFE